MTTKRKLRRQRQGPLGPKSLRKLILIFWSFHLPHYCGLASFGVALYVCASRLQHLAMSLQFRVFVLQMTMKLLIEIRESFGSKDQIWAWHLMHICFFKLASRIQKPVKTAVRDLAELQTTDPIAGKCATLFRTHIALGSRGKAAGARLRHETRALARRRRRADRKARQRHRWLCFRLTS